MHAGMSAPPCPPGEYTAPEVWGNLQSARSPATTGAVDVWALGAFGFEMMTGERVLTSAAGQQRVCAEGLLERAEEAASSGKLGVLRDVILDCLADQPSVRPTARTIVPVRTTPCSTIASHPLNLGCSGALYRTH